MSFWSSLVGGVTGFLSGGWPGAAAGLFGGAGGGRSTSSGPPLDMSYAPGAGTLNKAWDPQALERAYQAATSTSSQNAAGGTASPSMNLQDIYNSYLGRAMSGAGGTSNSAVSQQLGSLNTIFNSQASKARENMKSALGQRGMLSTGVYERGLANVEASKAQAMSSAASQVLQNQLASQMAAQQAASQQYLNLQQARWNAEVQARQMGLSQAEINNTLNQADNAAVMQLAASLGQLYSKTGQRSAAPAAASTSGGSGWTGYNQDILAQTGQFPTPDPWTKF